MDTSRDIEQIMGSILISKQPDLRPLEITGRMLLAHAALEYARYGAGSDHLLQAYDSGHAGNLRAEFLRTEQLIDDREDKDIAETSLHDKIVVSLGKKQLILAHEFCYADMKKIARTHKAVISPHLATIEMLENTPWNPLLGSQRIGLIALEGDTLAQFSEDIREQIDRFEIILDPANIVSPQEHTE